MWVASRSGTDGIVPRARLPVAEGVVCEELVGGVHGEVDGYDGIATHTAGSVVAEGGAPVAAIQDGVAHRELLVLAEGVVAGSLHIVQHREVEGCDGIATRTTGGVVAVCGGPVAARQHGVAESHTLVGADGIEDIVVEGGHHGEVHRHCAVGPVGSRQRHLYLVGGGSARPMVGHRGVEAYPVPDIGQCIGAHRVVEVCPPVPVHRQRVADHRIAPHGVGDDDFGIRGVAVEHHAVVAVG